MIKYKVLANSEQLKSIGIDYDISGLIGKLITKYPSGWYTIEITHDNQDIKFTNEFDIPKKFLKLVE